jgi:para-nitrobenzyl esterase
MKPPLHRPSLLLILVMGLSLVCNQADDAPAALDDPIRIESGLIAGEMGADASIRAYKGIPFAAPPVDSLRWRLPQPPASWDGVRSADSFSAACMQNVAGERLPWTQTFMHQGEVSEDCLYLNVWTAAASADENQPVMVYIYGGGFNEGSSAVAVYDGEELAKKGVVLVSFNYRVGPLGFMAHPALTDESAHDASGNYGLLDQVAALEWVQHNIAAFGGDPSRVTIFGQSAGAMSVALLLQSPLAEGLFDRAIIQSGPGVLSSQARGTGTPLTAAEEAGERYGETLGASTLADLRALPAERFTEPVNERFGPIVDGWFMPKEKPYRSDVPVINGFTADESGLFGGFSFGAPPEAGVEAYETKARDVFGDKTDAFLNLYPPTSDSVIPERYKTGGRDRGRVSVSLWAAQQAERGRAVYNYYFDRAIPWPEHPEFGAFHTSEVPYVFNNLDVLDRPWKPVDRTIAHQVSSYWVNFASTGNPNGADLPSWPAFSERPDRTMALGADMEPISLASPDEVAFWRSILIHRRERRRSPFPLPPSPCAQDMEHDSNISEYRQKDCAPVLLKLCTHPGVS